jgi:hypothetical protein
METHLLRRLLRFYQQRMVEARAKGDSEVHAMYRQWTRELSEAIYTQEKTVCSQQTA